MRPPLRALWLVLGAIVVSVVLSIGAQLLVHHTLGGGRSVTILSGLAAVWVSLGSACVIASRRYGTGHTFRDFGVAFEWRDIGRGPAITMIAFVAVSIVSRVVFAAGPRFHGSNASLLRAPKGDVIGAALLVAAAVVGAPFFEEMFFRGLLQRTLESKLSTAWAAVAQAGLFGFVHFQVILGLGNIGLVITITAIGLVFGLAMDRFRRVGPTVIAHGCFNGLVALALYASHR